MNLISLSKDYEDYLLYEIIATFPNIIYTILQN